MNAMPEERFLLAQLHELFMFLRQRGCGHFRGRTARADRPDADPGGPELPGGQRAAAALLRGGGAVRQAISVLKKRSGPHREDHPRTAARVDRRIVVGEPLTEFPRRAHRVPVYKGGAAESNGRGMSGTGQRRLSARAPIGRDASMAVRAAGRRRHRRGRLPTVDGLVRVDRRGRRRPAVARGSGSGGSACARWSICLDRQPPWSDLAVIVLAGGQFTSRASGRSWCWDRSATSRFWSARYGG